MTDQHVGEFWCSGESVGVHPIDPGDERWMMLEDDGRPVRFRGEHPIQPGELLRFENPTVQSWR